jgi:outer membrane protein OmpA-like peptidoglycan-associated protein
VDGVEAISEQGKELLDAIATPYLRVAANTPLMLEGYAAEGTEQEQFLRSRERARIVRQYLIDRFDLKPNYVGAVPMGAVRSEEPSGGFFEGVGVVYFPEKSKRGRR